MCVSLRTSALGAAARYVSNPMQESAAAVVAAQPCALSLFQRLDD